MEVRPPQDMEASPRFHLQHLQGQRAAADGGAVEPKPCNGKAESEEDPGIGAGTGEMRGSNGGIDRGHR